MENYEPQKGIWTLTAPDGTEYKGKTPLKAVGQEQDKRVPAGLAIKRLKAALNAYKQIENDELSKVDNIAIEICAFVKSNEYPEFGSEKFLEFTQLMDKLETILRQSNLIPKGRWPQG